MPFFWQFKFSFLTTILLIGSAFTTHLQDQNRKDTLDSRRSVYYIEGQNGSGTYYRDFSLQDVETMNQKVRHGNPFVRYRTMSLGLVDEQDSNLIHTYHAIVYSGDIRSIVISQPDIIVPQEGLIADHTLWIDCAIILKLVGIFYDSKVSVFLN